MAGFNAPIAHVSLDKTAVPLGASLRDGGFVFVRVLSVTAGGRALVSFAGRQFEVNSPGGMEAGTAFRAQIKISGQTIFLVPQTRSDQAGEFRQITAANLFNPQNAALFASLGLTADSVSFNLLQQLQQGGFKIHASRILKAKKAAEAFSGNEDEAAEVSLHLLQKGIEPEAALIAQFLQLLQGGSQFCGGENSQKKPADNSEENFPANLYENAASIPQLPAGLLTLSNHLKNGKNHWIVLPYEYGGGENFFCGSIRILCDLESKICKKLAVSVYGNGQNLYFFADFIFCRNSADSTLNKRKMHVYYSSEPLLSQQEQRRQTVLLEKTLGGCTVEYSETLAGHAFFVPEKPLYCVNMEA